MSTTTTTSVPTAIVAGINVLDVKIPLDREAAFALYAKVRDAEKSAMAALPASAKDTGGDSKRYAQAHASFAENFRYPRQLLWDRIVPVHQGGQGRCARKDGYVRWLTRHGLHA
jgi:hypothetical protein